MADFERIRLLEKNQNIAVVVAGSFGGLAVARELGRQKIPTIALAEHRYLTTSKYYLGLHMGDTSRIIGFLAELPKHLNKKPVLLTDNERGLELFHENLDFLKEHYIVPLNSGNLLVTDKSILPRTAGACGLKTPKIWDEIDSITEYPVLIKPLQGSTHHPLEKTYTCHNQKEVFQVLHLFQENHLKAIIQQMVPGDTKDLFNVMLYRSSQGEILAGSVTIKVREYPRTHGTGTAHITCDRPELLEYSKKLLDSVDYFGVAEIEFKYDKKNQAFYIIEVNGRFPLETGIVRKIGNQFIYQIYQDLISTPTDPHVRKEPKQQKSAFKDGKPILWSYFVRDISAAKSKASLFAEYCAFGLRSRIQWAVWDKSDIKPMLYYYMYLLKRLFTAPKKEKP